METKRLLNHEEEPTNIINDRSQPAKWLQKIQKLERPLAHHQSAEQKFYYDGGRTELNEGNAMFCWSGIDR